ncbi:hypothetical protein B0H63DRAFT_131712 [Podospora didyma]|uniref:Pyridoxamine 5'-phosphate oxidase Alr4036 family FMN-binding domain-containing protein n=1 Tax=Podospora didyma TaxID=330526 RepID=A0AAE0U588_9PEZI|nr:hypothetical protein B0H63DRAFT_131712 [Podospora didyma]
MMATTMIHHQANRGEEPCTPAPWRDLFLTHIASMQPAATLTLATTHPDATPRARTCVYRGLWGSLPPNERNPAPRNPEGVFESDLPVITTDARMEKAEEIGVLGGPVEAVFWAEDHSTQWRLRGDAYLLGRDGGGKEVRGALAQRTRRLPGGEEKEWSWSAEVTRHFGNLSPVMRGSFRNPPPGTPLATTTPAEGEGLGQTVEDLHDEIARRNFRVVVIVPNEVDQVDLTDPKRARRWLYTYRGMSYKATHPGGEVIGEWEKVEVWP